MFKIDPTDKPAVIVEEIFVSDPNGILRAELEASVKNLTNVTLLDDLINPVDQIANLNIEGLDVISGGGFYLTHFGTLGDSLTGTLQTPDLILRTDSMGAIQEVITLPDAVNAKQEAETGLTGVALDPVTDNLVVTFASAFADESHPQSEKAEPFLLPQ